jgi:hypothetical protein
MPMKNVKENITYLPATPITYATGTLNLTCKEEQKIREVWDVTPCSLIENYQRFGRICSFHHQERDYHEDITK